MVEILVHLVTTIDDYHYSKAKTVVEILVDLPSSRVMSSLPVTMKQQNTK